MELVSFAEYLDNNKKLKTKADTEKVADYKGKIVATPEKEKKPENAGGTGQTGKINPYKVSKDEKDPNKGRENGGLAEKGDKQLKYEPKTDVPADFTNNGSKKASWPHTETQKWINNTKDMSLAEFTKKIRSESLKGMNDCPCKETPTNSIKETVEICKCNNKYISSLVREIKRNGLFESLTQEIFSHKEAYNELAKIMESSEMPSIKLVNALNELVSPPIGMNAALPKKKKHHLDMPQDDDDSNLNLGDEEEQDFGDEDAEDDNTDDLDSPDSEESPDDLGGEENLGEEEPSNPKLLPFKKKKHGIDHLTHAMQQNFMRK
jgi:hypothetical protein